MVNCFLKETITYFKKATSRKENTQEVIKIVKEYLLRNPIKHIIIGSSWGNTAVKLVKALEDKLPFLNIVVVKLSQGCEELLSIKFLSENLQFLKEKGIPILTSTHSLTCAVPHAIMKKYGGISETELIADTLRLFSQGTNTCLEISLMAADANLVPEGCEALVIGGTNGGADTVIILKVATTPYFFKTRVLKILAKPIG